MWKNVVDRGRPQMTIWRMRIACWIPKVTNTRSVCNVYCLSHATMFARMRLNVTYTHNACLVLTPVDMKVI
jgi:hypothetical protein